MIKTDGKTKLIAVIGDPIKHSLSPAIHSYFIEQSGLNLVNLAFNIKKESLRDFFYAAKTLDIIGFNATMPLKELCFAEVDETGGEVCGSVNTVVLRDGIFKGYTTDGEGFVRSLIQYGINPGGKNITILGAGGAARSLIYTLTGKKANVSVCARTPERVSDIVDKNHLHSWDNIGFSTQNADIVVNCTPLGMNNLPDFDSFSFLDGLPKGGLIYDLIYSPRKTNLLFEAEKRGFDTLNGLPHLIHQAALSFELFTGILPKDETISDLCEIIQKS